MGLKSLTNRLKELEQTNIVKNLSIEDAIKSFPKDVHRFGFDLSSYLKELGFKLEDIVGYMIRDELYINFFKNSG